MLENLKNKTQSPAFQNGKTIVISVTKAIAIGVAIRVVTYVAVEGTKALIEEFKNRTNETEVV